METGKKVERKTKPINAPIDVYNELAKRKKSSGKTYVQLLTELVFPERISKAAPKEAKKE